MFNGVRLNVTKSNETRSNGQDRMETEDRVE